MEKILLVIGENELNMPALDFACYLGRLTHSTITGIILESVQKPILTTAGSTSIDGKVEEPSSNDTRQRSSIEATLSRFKRACENRSVHCTVHCDSGIPAEEIIYESRFADLIVVDAATSFRRNFEGRPTEFVKDVLKDAECPVIIAPESFYGLSEIVFTYDGSKSSAFAIKQFAYLFPELDDKKVVLLQVNEEGEWTEDEKQRWTEWLINHYSVIDFQALKGGVNDKLFDYLFGRKNCMVVLGAYGRNTVSRFFKTSHADRIIKTMTLPIFISHY
ncbi:MAG TPA: universal stress protein [Chitinophagaceae bacterium]|jgi:nucleotide-binding universal stress UspA family protein|nr:universal stress protein [Chitinophagaceae bacterium]